MDESQDAHLLSIADRKVPLIFKKDERAQRIILRLDYGASRIVVVRPKRTSRHTARSFVLENRSWIEERINELLDGVPFEHGATIPFMGLEHRIRHRPSARGVVWCEEQEIHVAGHAEHLSRRVTDWLRMEARREIESKAKAKAMQIGKRVKRVILRDTTSRWGSCSTDGQLSFSWRLIMAPRYVLDYVISHEVAHLSEMNHGPRFWKLCRKLCKSITAARVWLDQNGTDLYRYGRKA